MADTLLLDIGTWDLVVDIYGNIAVASVPYSQAQDAASAIKTFLGETYYDTTLGVPYNQILGQFPPLALMKQQFVNAALTVPGVVSAQVFISAFQDRVLFGQVQITNDEGKVAATNFTFIPSNIPTKSEEFVLDVSTLGGADVLGS